MQAVTPGIILGGSHVWAEEFFESLCPRALLPIANAPLISYVLDWLKKAGVKTVIVCANDAGRPLQEYLGDGARHDLDLFYYQDRIPRGPAGCSRDGAAIARAEQYVVVEGSIIPAIDLAALLDCHTQSRAAATVVVNQVADGDDEYLGPHLSPAGVYVFSRRALQHVAPTGYEDIKEMLVPRLHSKGEVVMAYPAERPSPRVNGPESYLAAQWWMLRALRDSGSMPAGYQWQNGACLHESARVAESARLMGPAMVGPGTCVEAESIVIGPTVIGGDCVLGKRSVVSRSVMWDRCSIGPGARMDRCLVTREASIEAGAAEYGVIC